MRTLIATLAAGAILAACSRAPATPETALLLPDGNPIPAFSLLDQNGRSIDRTVFEGRWDLVFFGFTHCPDICPATLQVLSAARTRLKDEGQSPLPRIVLVSVDPERDTPEVIGQYLEYFGEGHLGITGDLGEVRKLTDGLGIYFEKHAIDDDNYSVDHSSSVLVIDPAGRFSALFGGPHVIESYVHDLPIVMDAG